ncbi:MAG: Gfo/Idh/MocA family oxidoreductase, partial [Ferruginibacter sp.]
FIEAHPHFSLDGAWERSTRLIQQQYPHTHSYPSLETVLANDAIQLIVVNTPTYTHFDYAKACLLAGKHVIVEKAFTTTVEEAIELQQLATAKNCMLAVYHNRRWDSDFLTTQKVVHSGILGNIHEASIRFERFKTALSPKLHKETPNAGAGLLKDLGPHCIDQAITLFGMPEKVFADIRIVRAQSQIDDDFSLTLYYPNCRVHIKASLLHAAALPAFELHGNKGSFTKERGDVQEAALLAGVVPGSSNWGEEPAALSGKLTLVKEKGFETSFLPTEKGNYMQFYNGIYEALTHQINPPVTAVAGIQVMQIIEAAIQSNIIGKSVAIQPL